MYRLPYAEVLDDDNHEARRREYEAFDQVITKLEAGDTAGCNSVTAIEALYTLQQLWMILMDDLAHSENGLPDKLRASLISIGIWVLKECDRIRRGEIESLRSLIEINIIVRNGLR